MKRLDTILNTIMAAFVGVFIGHAIYVVWDFQTHQQLYAMQSAPWYTSILMSGGFTLAILLVCIIIKAIANHNTKKSNNK